MAPVEKINIEVKAFVLAATASRIENQTRENLVSGGAKSVVALVVVVVVVVAAAAVAAAAAAAAAVSFVIDY